NELILAPREFDFPDFNVESFQHYIGFMTHRRQADSGPENFDETWEKILAKKLTTGLALIYCSFGTIESAHKHIILSFLEKLMTVVQRVNHLLVVSIKDQQVLDKFQTNQTDKVYFFPSVPQIKVLRDANLFITHGGLSSIKESIEAEVPMLMYPVHSDYDPKGNAARVVYHGMGLRGDAKRDLEEKIQRNIQELLTNKKFRENVLKLKHQNKIYSSERIISLFRKIHSL
ncbi:MAG: hypothetical protein C0490_27245, partial [Marivirga sp.]|nr:hypothetical protein [Marivirga sp.]